MTRYYDKRDLRESAEDWETFREGLAAIGRHAEVLAGEHGAIDPQRALHAGVRPESMRHGVPTPTAAPDPFTGQRATIKRGRSKRGTTARVTHVGRAFVSGPEPTGLLDSTGRVASVRWDAVTLAAWADKCLSESLAEGETLTSEGLSLVGSVQGRSWEQMVRAEGSSDAVTLAQHRCGIGGGFVSERSVIVGSAARADHKYRPTHSLTLGWSLAEATDAHKGRPVRKVARFPISRMRRDGAPIIPASTVARKLDLDAVESVSESGRTSYRKGGIDDRGRFVTYGDSVVSRREIPDASRPGRTRTVIRSLPTERIAVGFHWTDRPAPATATRDSHAARTAARAERREREAREARDAIVAIGNGASVVEAWDSLAEDERASLALPAGGTLSFTRHDGRPVRYRFVRGAEVREWTSRTPQAAAMRLATYA